jgi:hypothetical protein
MPVKYLSQEWIDAYNDALAGDAVRTAMKGKNATIQMVISDAPEAGEIRYWLRIEDGGAAAGLGDLDGPDVTIRQSYETSAQVNRGELDGQKAFTQGKVKIGGKMLKMMQLRTRWPRYRPRCSASRPTTKLRARPGPLPRRARDHIQSACRGQASSVSTTSVGPVPGSVAAYRPR